MNTQNYKMSYVELHITNRQLHWWFSTPHLVCRNIEITCAFFLNKLQFAAHVWTCFACIISCTTMSCVVTTQVVEKILWPSFFPYTYFNFSYLGCSLSLCTGMNVTQGVVQYTYTTLLRRCISPHHNIMHIIPPVLH